MVIKDKNRNNTINCPFNIGDVVTITNFSYAYFRWWVETTPRLKELCLEQYGEGDPTFYNTHDVPKEWKVKHVLCDEFCNHKSIDVVLINRFRQTIAMQVYVVRVGLNLYQVDKTALPFTVIDTKRKTIDYLEIETEK